MTRLEEFSAKLGRLRGPMERSGYDAVGLSTQASFAWLACGGDSHVAMATEAGVARLLVTADAVHLLTSNIEAPRMRAEEMGELPIQVHEWNWHDGDEKAVEADLLGGLRVAADGSWPAGATNEAPALARLRWALLEPEVVRYRWVGRAATEALSQTARAIEPGMTEHEVAGILGGSLLGMGLTPAVLLVAADERAFRFRHPIPTDRPLERKVLMSIGARRWGLGISATRVVHFGPPDDDLIARHRAICRVDACFIAGTRPGAEVRDVFARAVETYAEVGFPDEWRMHHQGGATGYAPRDYRATAACPEVVLDGQAFAWNPTIAGTKSEDTILAREGDAEVLSAGDDWPVLEVECCGAQVRRPDILVR
jgi:Xaa-Pro aminopeptidase